MRQARGGIGRSLRPARRKLQLLAKLHARFHQEVSDMILRSTAFALVLALAASPAMAQVAPTPTPPATPAPTEPRETIEGTLSQDRTAIARPGQRPHNYDARDYRAALCRLAGPQCRECRPRLRAHQQHRRTDRRLLPL